MSHTPVPHISEFHSFFLALFGCRRRRAPHCACVFARGVRGSPRAVRAAHGVQMDRESSLTRLITLITHSPFFSPHVLSVARATPTCHTQMSHGHATPRCHTRLHAVSSRRRPKAPKRSESRVRPPRRGKLSYAWFIHVFPICHTPMFHP